MSSIAVRLKYKHTAQRTILRNSPAFGSCNFSSNPNNDENNDNSQTKSSISSYFSDVRASLKHQSQEQPPRQQQNNRQQQQQSFPRQQPFPSSQDSQQRNASSLDDIRKSLSNYRARNSSPNPSFPSSSGPQSASQKEAHHDLYKRDGASKGGLSIESIRNSLKTIKNASQNNQGTRNSNNTLSLSRFKESLNLRPRSETLGVSGGGVGSGAGVRDGAKAGTGGAPEKLPMHIFGKELKEKKEEDKSGDDVPNMDFVRIYTKDELGNKLRSLRPEGVAKKNDWFSLTELSERLTKLRELEEKELRSGTGGAFLDLRQSLMKLKLAEDDEKSKKSSFQRLDLLSPITGTQSFLEKPPKEELVQRFFHPDNMSAAEKMKLELKRIRDEFKKHETDCGSEPVQIAQLTMEISHLASVLHKKDKHSRRGLLAKVQKRKLLLKYLRRTDWDSYCLVLSKLGLRDNPDHKNQSETKGQAGKKNLSKKKKGDKKKKAQSTKYVKKQGSTLAPQSA